MALTQVSTGGIKDGQVQTADLADGQVTVGKLHADALDRTYTLGADGSNHYTFTGEGLTGAVNDPTLYLTRGKTYRFVNGNSAGAHPFRIQTTVNGSAGTEYNTGVTNNGGAGGSTIVFEVPHDAPDVLYYQCTSHGSMGGIFYVTGALADGTVTTAKLADQAVTLAKLPHGTSSNDGKFLRANNGADPSFETVTSTTINNNADNRVITGSGTANTLNAETNVFIDSSGRVGIGVSDVSNYWEGGDQLVVADTGTGGCGITIHADTDDESGIFFADGTAGNAKYEGYIQYYHSDNSMRLATNAVERMRIDSSGKLILTDNIKWASADAYVYSYNGGSDGQVRSGVEYSGSNQTIRYFTGTNERMRITSDGHVIVGSTSADSNNSDGIRLFNYGSVHSTRTNEYAYVARRSSSNGGIVLFRRDSTDVGNISVTTSATSYNSGSDYRLKQDDKPLIDGLTRLKQLKPIQFKWKNDTSKFVDGFFAHEVSPVVPESITGEKDAVYEEDDDLGHKKGDPIYQQIDQAKLVPLLTAALQEAIAKIETLETKVAALEAA